MAKNLNLFLLIINQHVLQSSRKLLQKISKICYSKISSFRKVKTLCVLNLTFPMQLKQLNYRNFDLFFIKMFYCTSKNSFYLSLFLEVEHKNEHI